MDKGNRIRLLHVVVLVIVLAAYGVLPAHSSENPIVILVGPEVEAYRSAAEGAKKALQDLRTIVLPVNADLEHLKHVMEKVSLMSPKAIIAIGSEAALAVKTTPVGPPVVFCLVVDHQGWLERPRSWAVSIHLSPEDSFDRIRLALPKKRIGIPYNPERTGRFLKELIYFSRKAKIELVPIIVQKPSELGPALTKARADYDALWILPDPSFIDTLSAKYVIEYSIHERIPIIGYSEGFTKNGAVLSLAGNYEDMGRQAAELAIRVGSGSDPAHIEYPRRIKTYINLRVARILNLDIAQTLIAQADRIYPINPSLRIPEGAR